MNLQAQAAANTYRMNQIRSASPLDLLIMTYDAALAACAGADLERSTRAISYLRDTLVWDYDAESTMGFFRLYQYCNELVREGKYDEAAHILRELRDTWAQVKNQMAHQAA